MLDLIKSFSFALLGIIDAINHERNFRLHWLLGMMVLLLVSLWDLALWQQSVIFLLVFLVLAFELHNCAIEKTCDSSGAEFNYNKKRAKDFAAGSVLLFCFGAALIFFLFIYTNLETLIKGFMIHSLAYLSWFFIGLCSMPMIFQKKLDSVSITLFFIGIAIDFIFICISSGQPWFLAAGMAFHIVMAIAFIKRITMARYE